MSAKKTEKIRGMIAAIEDIILRARQLEESYAERLSKVHPSFEKSARNLIHYRALRMEDLRDLQKQLGNMGFSRLAKAEAHTMASLRTTRSILRAYLEGSPVKFHKNVLSPKRSKQFHKRNAKALLGYRSKKRRSRIMVTLPSQAAEDYQLVHDMVAHGMNCARINCAHDDEATWKRMIDHVRQAAESLHKNVKVCMDLAGPKIRTGALPAGPKVRKYRPAKDMRGQIPQALEAWSGPSPHPELPHIPIEEAHLDQLKAGQTLYLRDARFKKRCILLFRQEETGFIVHIPKTTYLETGLPLFTSNTSTGPFVPVGELPPVEQHLLLHPGDSLRIHRSGDPGAPACFDESGVPIAMAHISCTSEEVFEQVQPGDPILFDDGKIEGIIRETAPEAMIVEIVHTSPGGGKLRADKGINFPDSDLQISGLTAKDRQDLSFIAQYADVVNVSFVNTADDVRDLIGEFDRLDAREKLGVILKIETQRGFNNLTDILLEAMQVYPIGVMIARGDLAIETGWQNIGRVQEEILLMCRAAHIPDIWATQVLENLAKRGIPSRAEITDAAMAQRTDCVMLNKGPYILQAIRLLDTILKDLAPYQDKSAPMLPALKKASLKT
jgi:pyruvate kinase